MKTKIKLCYITKMRITAMRMNENEKDSGQKTHLVFKKLRSHQQLHGPFMIACWAILQSSVIPSITHV